MLFAKKSSIFITQNITKLKWQLLSVSEPTLDIKITEVLEKASNIS